MLPSFRVVVLSLCSTTAAACGFDSDGLATGSNSAGTLESSGGASEGDENSTTSPPTTSATTADPTVSTTDETGPSTSPMTTASESSGSGGGESSSGSSGAADAGPESSGSDTSSGGVPSESSESGEPAAPYYADCDGNRDCGPEGQCFMFDVAGGGTGHVCYVPCEDADDCPTPESGAAPKVCTPSGCAIDCDDLSCPDGMTCGAVLDGGYYIERCVWAD